MKLNWRTAALVLCAVALCTAAAPRHSGDRWNEIFLGMQRTDSGVGKIWKTVKFYGNMSDTIRACTAGNYIFVTDIAWGVEAVNANAPDRIHLALFEGVSQTDSLWWTNYRPQYEGGIYQVFTPRSVLTLSPDSSLVIRMRTTASGAADTVTVTICGVELPD